jgi:fatty-acyl-CoA synthase
MALIEAEQTKPKKAGQKGALRDWLRALEATAPITANPERLLCRVIEEWAHEQGDAPALLSANGRLTYRDLVARTNRFARWALAQNISKGSIVGLMMPNCPDYLAIWLGLSSVGVVVALINTQLRGGSLAHCIDVAAPTHLIAGAEYVKELDSILPSLGNSPQIWMHGNGNEKAGGAAHRRIDHFIEDLSGEPIAQSERRPVSINDRALLIYTSGTTGLPKAANVSHRRILQWSFWFAGLLNIRHSDRMYDCLPMYHSVGGVVATGALLAHGGSVLIRDKFSAAQFWNDVVKGDCTLFQYIGELTRYLLHAPASHYERSHRLRLCCGNGMRADVWEQFQQRFAIPRIVEFYAATEGNISLYNVEGKVGAIGRIPPFLRSRFPLALVKFDEAAGAPARDASGFCIHCATNEIGEAISNIPQYQSSPGSPFEGYTDDDDTERKILRNVFEPGDAWFRTGDLMRIDEQGFYYFVDRVGDTYRWKGENVAASEVAAAIARFPGVKQAVVYGVHVPGAEGTAGMAAILPDGTLDLAALHAHLARQLPSYARPVFLRITDAITATSTFKPIKHDLKRQGFDPATTTDPIYFDDPAKKVFVALDAALYGLIQDGGVRI